MIYAGTLGSGQHIAIANPHNQTQLTLTSSAIGQQQSQSYSLTTGQWIVPPTLFQTRSGFIVRIEAERGNWFIQLNANGMQVLTDNIALTGATVLPLQPIAAPATATSEMSPMPMPSMKPMQMGNLSMQMEPMTMQMGDMKMQMGTPLTTSQQRFCSHCGQAVKPEDRFCSGCGHSLQS